MFPNVRFDRQNKSVLQPIKNLIPGMHSPLIRSHGDGDLKANLSLEEQDALWNYQNRDTVWFAAPRYLFIDSESYRQYRDAGCLFLHHKSFYNAGISSKFRSDLIYSYLVEHEIILGHFSHSPVTYDCPEKRIYQTIRLDKLKEELDAMGDKIHPNFRAKLEGLLESWSEECQRWRNLEIQEANVTYLLNCHSKNWKLLCPFENCEDLPLFNVSDFKRLKQSSYEQRRMCPTERMEHDRDPYQENRGSKRDAPTPYGLCLVKTVRASIKSPPAFTPVASDPSPDSDLAGGGGVGENDRQTLQRAAQAIRLTKDSSKEAVAREIRRLTNICVNWFYEAPEENLPNYEDIGKDTIVQEHDWEGDPLNRRTTLTERPRR